MGLKAKILRCFYTKNPYKEAKQFDHSKYLGGMIKHWPLPHL